MEEQQKGEKQFNSFMWGLLIALIIAVGVLTNWIIAAVITTLTFIFYFKFLHKPQDKPQEIPAYKQAIPQWVKEQVWQIQKGKCCYCGEPITSRLDIEWHHIKPQCQGGSSLDPNNLSLLHSYCHNRLTRSRRLNQ